MDYRLYETDNPAEAVATAEHADDFEAEKWARSWASGSGRSDDYLVRRADDRFSARLFRTSGGQWYVMRQ